MSIPSVRHIWSRPVGVLVSLTGAVALLACGGGGGLGYAGPGDVAGGLVVGVAGASGRVTVNWMFGVDTLPKPAIKVLLNLAQIALEVQRRYFADFQNTWDAVLADVRLRDGTPLVQGKALTGFTNEEEAVFGTRWALADPAQCLPARPGKYRSGGHETPRWTHCHAGH